MHKIMDFRSDTVTRPSEEMRKVIASAAVGDDIYGDDPSSNALCEYAAEITGKEAAIYACSGTMGNLLAFVAAGRQGESVLAGKRSHVWCSEVGGLSAIAGLCPYPLNDDSGIPAPEELAPAAGKWKSLGLSEPRLVSYALEDMERCVAVWDKVAPTPKGIPRRPGMAEKFPWYLANAKKK